MNTITSPTPDDLKPPRGRQVSHQRHGLRGAALPKGCGHIRKSVDTFRRATEAAILDQHGEISLYHASLVNSAYRHERTAALCERWVRVEQENLDPSQRLAYLKLISDATDRRDKCLERLGLDKPDDDPWSLPNFPELASPYQTPQDAASDAPAANVDKDTTGQPDALDGRTGDGNHTQENTPCN